MLVVSRDGGKSRVACDGDDRGVMALQLKVLEEFHELRDLSVTCVLKPTGLPAVSHPTITIDQALIQQPISQLRGTHTHPHSKPQEVGEELRTPSCKNNIQATQPRAHTHTLSLSLCISLSLSLLSLSLSRTLYLISLIISLERVHTHKHTGTLSQTRADDHDGPCRYVYICARIPCVCVGMRVCMCVL